MPIHQAQDKFFKKSFGKKEVTKDFLLSRLPRDVLEKVDIDSLEKQNTSFVSEAFRAFHSDLVYRMNTKGDGNGYVYLLIEAQSASHEFMAFRLLEYDVCIIRHEVEQQLKEGRPKKTLHYLPSSTLCYALVRSRPTSVVLWMPFRTKTSQGWRLRATFRSTLERNIGRRSSKTAESHWMK